MVLAYVPCHEEKTTWWDVCNNLEQHFDSGDNHAKTQAFKWLRWNTH